LGAAFGSASAEFSPVGDSSSPDGSPSRL
jgi:hypothetical protein